MDPLSDVLRAVRLSGAFFYLVEAAPPWSVPTAPARELVPRVLPDAEHLISYHILLSGTCWAGLEGEDQIQMQPGDVVVFPHGDAHVMSSARGFWADRARLSSPARYLHTVHIGSEGECDPHFVCGVLGCDASPFNPLLASLPRRLHAPGLAAGWLAHIPRQVVTESSVSRIGSETLLTRMAELMFVEVVRRHLEQLPAQNSGWLAGLRDPVVGPALAQFHDRPAHPWTLAQLTKTIASSRTVLVERFSELVGCAPMQYLTRWRLQLAAERLRSGSAKVAAIASQVGYESEAAFSRAFKRETGVSPAMWRRARQGRAGAPIIDAW